MLAAAINGAKTAGAGSETEGTLRTGSTGAPVSSADRQYAKGGSTPNDGIGEVWTSEDVRPAVRALPNMGLAEETPTPEGVGGWTSNGGKRAEGR